MIGAMACFALVDAFIKLASETQSVGQIMALTSGAAFAIFTVWVWRDGGRMLSRDALNPVLLVRSATETLGSFGIFMALSQAPLSSVSALGQAQPLAVTVMAAVFLNETVGWRRLSAVLLGLLGVLIILRPGFGSFDPALLWVLLYVVGLAIRDIASRALPPTVTTPFAVAWSMLPMTLLGLALMPAQGGWHPVGASTFLWLVGVAFALTAALWMITSAMRVGEVSAVAPFRYSRIVFALIIAFVVFGEVPDTLTWVGAALIVGSGIYNFLRERRLQRA